MTAREQQHTPKPWRLPEDLSFTIVGPDYPDRGVVAHVNQHRGFTSEEGEANARRIVACVNACAGIETATLEDFAALGSIAKVHAQRDELAAALRGLWELRSSIINEARTHQFSTQRIEDALTAARAALAKLNP